MSSVVSAPLKTSARSVVNAGPPVTFTLTLDGVTLAASARSAVIREATALSSGAVAMEMVLTATVPSFETLSGPSTMDSDAGSAVAAAWASFDAFCWRLSCVACTSGWPDVDW